MADEGTRGPFVVPVGKTDISEDDRVIAGNVKRLREAAGMTQAELAHAMFSAGQTHWRQNTVSRVEHARQKLGMDDLEAISEVLGNVLEGTEVAQRISASAGALKRSLTLQKLRAADDALAEALMHVRGLRVLHEPDFDAASVRAAYEEDARRGQHQAEE